ncbi:hypothetical protein Back11_38710 [Paenibacillus baekrokdamisoli]|uniref:Uncharacterized protein n=1 Tax=Paenibacillus baekrokdamisoli TaxID=1712516 RepID=A0A3G9IVM1_9BACL|nr:hypothetical protein Back11_38710 [Paenibacillus baekrokdamisoli]
MVSVSSFAFRFLAEAHIRAANWLENNGFDEESVEHYLKGETLLSSVLYQQG